MITIVMPTGRLLGGAERALLAALEGADLRSRLRRVVFLEEGDLVDQVRLMGVHVEVLPLDRTRDLVRLIRVVRGLARLLRQDARPVVLSWMTKAAVVAAPAARLARGSHIVYQHGSTSRSGLDRLVSYLPVDLVVCCSEWTRRSAAGAWPRFPTAVTYPPLTESTFSPPSRHAARSALHLSQDEQLVVMVSRWQQWKRVHLAVEAATEPGWPDGTRLILVGGPVPTEPEYGAVVDGLISRAPSGRVTSVGFDREGQRWMAAADVVLHLSDSEPFGLVLVEGAAVGVPIVTTGGGGASELIEQLDDCFLTPPSPTHVAAVVSSTLATRSPGADGRDLASSFGSNAWWDSLVVATAAHSVRLS